MKNCGKAVWQILVIAVWINVSESVRWVLYSKPKFDALYRAMGRELPNRLSNGIWWMVWGLIMALLVFVLARKFTLLQTALLAWTAVFAMLWIALWNYAILPLDILWIAAPLSLLGVFIAAWIAKWLQGREAK